MPPVNPVVAVAGQNAVRQYQVAMVQMYVDLALEATSAMSKQLVDLGVAFARGAAPTERARIHAEVARQARRSTQASYAQTVSRRGGPSGYRANATGPMRRYSGGRLKRALGQDNYWISDANGITLDMTPLDRAAAQVWRLNFGAGARGQGSLPPVAVRFGVTVIAVIGLDEAARPGFVIPAGFWETGAGRVGPDPGRRGMDEFYVSSSARSSTTGRLRRGDPSARSAPRQNRIATKGIAGRSFLDRGLIRVATELPARYQILYRDLYRQGETKVRPRSITIATTPGRRRASDLSIVAGQAQSRLARRSL